MTNLVYKYILSDVGKVLWDNLNDPEEWEFEDYTMLHIRSRVYLWTNNGGFFFDGYKSWRPESLAPSLGLLERHFIYRKAMRLRDQCKTIGNGKIIDVLGRKE